MKLLLAMLLALCAVPASAQNWANLLKNSAAERFDEEDLRLFMDNARKALAEGAENQTLAWENPKTRARGEITVVRRFEWNKLPCKEMRITNETPGRNSTNTRHLCEVDGKWRLVSASQLRKK